jgi:hypothetical protein
MNAETKVDTPWMINVSFSDIPLLILFPFVVACVVTEAASSESKYAMFCRRMCRMKSRRSALVVRIAAIEMNA